MSNDLKIQKAVKNYLLKNPRFFAQHPELMSAIEVVETEGELTNLTTHQLRTLQQQNQQLKAQISQLIANAQQSESVMNRLFDLLTRLSVVDEVAYLPEFVAFVTEHFPADYFKLLVAEGMVELVESEHLALLNSSQVSQFAVFKAKPEPLFGRLKKDQIQSIFGSVDDIQSAVVLPIGDQAQFGLMAFASKDEEKFHPNSASDLLQKLAQVLAAYFTQLEPVDENQVMS